MSEVLGQEENRANNVESRMSAQKNASPIHFADVEKEADSVQDESSSPGHEDESAKQVDTTKPDDSATPDHEEESAQQLDTTEETNLDVEAEVNRGQPDSALPDHEEKSAQSPQTTKETNADTEKQEDALPDFKDFATKPSESNNEKVPGADNITTKEDMGDKMADVHEQNLPREESILFEVRSSDGDGPHRLDLETPDRETFSVKDGRTTASPYHPSFEEYTLLLEQLNNERASATEKNMQMQKKLALFLRKKTSEGDHEVERILRGAEQMKSYDNCLNVLTERKQQVREYVEKAEAETEELRRQAQEKLNKVDKEWRDLMSLKKDMSVMVLSRRWGKAEALVRVESTLSTEENQQDQLTKLRLQNFRLKTRVRRLETELREVDQKASDPLQLQYEQLQAQRRDNKKYMEKQQEEAIKVHKKMVRSLELLTNIKEKLHWTELEVLNRREQLERVDAILAQKRDILNNVKRARNYLQGDNRKLKEQRGLLGNEVLLRDYEHTVQSCAHLEERLQELKCRKADLDFYSGRRKKRLQTI